MPIRKVKGLVTSLIPKLLAREQFRRGLGMRLGLPYIGLPRPPPEELVQLVDEGIAVDKVSPELAIHLLVFRGYLLVLPPPLLHMVLGCCDGPAHCHLSHLLLIQQPRNIKSYKVNGVVIIMKTMGSYE